MKSDRASEDRDAYTRRRRERWDQIAMDPLQPTLLRNCYQSELTRLYRLIVPPGAKVLEAGCSDGRLLAELAPSDGVGVDISCKQLETARLRHPELRFVAADLHTLDLDERFDYVVASDLLNDIYDVQCVLQRLEAHMHSSSRLVLNIVNHCWANARTLLQSAGLVTPVLPQNWLSREDLRGLLALAGLEVVWHSYEILLPVPIPLLTPLANRILARLPVLRSAAISYFVVARQVRKNRRHAKVSVIVPARNEAGHIPDIPARIPEMGTATETVFVEGHSTDGTWDAIQNAIARHPDCDIKAIRQPGVGKGDAVRAGFDAATGEVLMILDADITVAPEDLSRFYEAWRQGHGDVINGVRMVYPMDGRAMRFVNRFGNRFFSVAFTWLIGQPVNDTLCGTKVLSKSDYLRIAAGREHFGRLDPFGDFDLLFGAARLKMKIVDMPVRYRERVYGETNISRWTHGWLLLRMLWLAVRRLKFV